MPIFFWSIVATIAPVCYVPIMDKALQISCLRSSQSLGKVTSVQQILLMSFPCPPGHPISPAATVFGMMIGNGLSPSLPQALSPAPCHFYFALLINICLRFSSGFPLELSLLLLLSDWHLRGKYSVTERWIEECHNFPFLLKDSEVLLVSIRYY